MSVSVQQKAEIIAEYGKKDGDTGCTEVQVALMTARINDLVENHFQAFPRDSHSRRGLLRLVSARRKLLAYLKRTNLDRYRDLIARLGLRK